jgi:hypothetical protein
MEKKEIGLIIISVIIMTLLIVFGREEGSSPALIRAFLVSIIILSLVVMAKRITANYLDVGIEHKIWEFQRYNIIEHSHFRRPIPLGLILPLLLSLFSLGIVKFFAFLQFESKALPSKAVKKYGLRRYSGIMEWDDALIVFYSLMPLLFIGLISKFIPGIFFADLARYSMIYVISNLIPIGKLDGTKLFFGSIPLFVFTWIITIIAMPIIF